MTNVLLIDLSSIAHPIFHTEIDPSATSTKTVERVRALASGQPHVGVCVEGGRSFRKDLDPTYKGNRPEPDASLYHQIDVAIDILRADGFPILRAEGLEADDMIGSAVFALKFWRQNVADFGETTIVSADKDLLQLVDERVSVKSLKDGSIIDAAAVETKFGVRPDQMLDFLALCGDASDNIKGCEGVGKVRAAGLLKKYGTIDGIYAAADKNADEFTPGLTTALAEFRPRLEGVRNLIRLRTDAPIDVSDVLKERVPLDVATFGGQEDEDMEGSKGGGTTEDVGSDDAVAAANRTDRGVLEHPKACGSGSNERGGADFGGVRTGREQSSSHDDYLGHRNAQQSAIVRRVSEVVEPTPVEWERQLEPRNMAQMKALATDLFASRLFSAYGHPAGVLSTILAGRELGLPAMAALRGFHIIDGKPTMAADLIRGLVMRSGAVEFFICTTRTNEKCTFMAKRKGEVAQELTFTIEDAKRAWSKGDAAWNNSGWNRNPADMLVARAGSKLARLVAPDVVSGLYAPEEME